MHGPRWPAQCRHPLMAPGRAGCSMPTAARCFQGHCLLSPLQVSHRCGRSTAGTRAAIMSCEPKLTQSLHPNHDIAGVAILHSAISICAASIAWDATLCLPTIAAFHLPLAGLAVAHPTAASGQGNTWPPGSNSSSSSGSADPGVTIILQPPPPPLTDAQRNRASKALQRSMQRQRQVNLSLSTQLDLLVLQPMPLYQQFCQGVGVYAGRAAAAACQSRQLDQDVREQDVQTADVSGGRWRCSVSVVRLLLQG